MRNQQNSDASREPLRPPTNPTQVVVQPNKVTEVDTYGMVGSDPLVLPFSAEVATQRPGSGAAAVAQRPKSAVVAGDLLEEDLKEIRKIDKQLKVGMKEQHSLFGEIRSLYRSLRGASAAPASESKAWNAVKYVASGFGLFDRHKKTQDAITSKLQEARRKQEEEVQVSSKKGKKVTTTSIRAQECLVRVNYANRTFEAESAPRILKQVSVPLGKDFLSFENLKKQVLEAERRAAKKISSGSSQRQVKVEQVSDERMVLRRQHEDGKWESIELSWNSLTKVHIAIDGKVMSIFNVDGAGAASRFFNFESVKLKKIPKDQSKIWKVVAP